MRTNLERAYRQCVAGSLHMLENDAGDTVRIRADVRDSAKDVGIGAARPDADRAVAVAGMDDALLIERETDTMLHTRHLVARPECPELLSALWPSRSAANPFEPPRRRHVRQLGLRAARSFASGRGAAGTCQRPPVKSGGACNRPSVKAGFDARQKARREPGQVSTAFLR